MSVTEAAATRQSARPATPSARRAVMAVTILFGVVALVAVAALAWTSTEFHRSMQAAIRDSKSRATANDLEVAALMYQRLGNSFLLSGDPELAATREMLLGEMRRAMSAARAYVGSEGEDRLLDDVEEELARYISERERLEAQGLEVDDVILLSRPFLDRALVRLEALRVINDTEVAAAYARVARLNDLSNLASIGAAIVLLLGFPIVGLGMRRYFLQPTLSLQRAITRFRAGESDARAPARGVRELTDLARSFNEMADTLASQRQQQLTFLAGVAHDLRGPLGALKMGLYSLEHQQSVPRREQTRATLDRQVDRLARMVEDLLDATRIEAGELEMREQRFDVRDVVDDVVRLYTPTSPSYVLEKRLPAEPVVILGDAQRIEQVVINLVSNAIKFSTESGRIRVEVSSDAREVVIAVSDQGIGIPSEEVPDLFLPFRRRRPDIAPGAGLGLSVVRRIVSAHHGTIGVTSEPGVGSCFTVRIPRAPAVEESTQSPAATRA